jgi:hypothetical protein
MLPNKIFDNFDNVGLRCRLTQPTRHLQKLGFRLDRLRVLDSFSEMSTI